MTFFELAKYLEKLEKTSSRLEITQILADLFKKSKVDEIDRIVYLTLGSLAPNYRGMVFNIADKIMLQIIAKACGIDAGRVRESYKKEGDLGVVTEKMFRWHGYWERSIRFPQGIWLEFLLANCVWGFPTKRL